MSNAALRDLLAVTVREIRRDLHMGRRERSVEEQCARAHASLSLDRLIARLNLEDAQAQLVEARKGSRQPAIDYAEAGLERAQYALVLAESNLRMSVPPRHGANVPCVDEVVPASENVEGATVPAAAALFLVALDRRSNS